MLLNRRDLLKTAILAGSAMNVTAARSSEPTTEPMKSYKRFAVEEGFNIPEIAAETQKFLKSRASEEPAMAAMWSRFAPPEGRGPPVWARELLDIGEGRIRVMDQYGISKQLLLLSSPGVQIFDEQQAMELARLANNRVAAAINAFPDRFAALTTVAPQNPDAAAQELERGVKQLGLKGALINSHTRGEYLDKPRYWPIFEAAQSLDVPIYIHPRTPSPEIAGPYVECTLEGAGWGFAVETSLHALRLIFSGVFDEFPDLRIVIGHMGEAIPFYLDRIDNRYLWEGGAGSRQGRMKLKRLPSEYFKDNFVITTSGMNWHAPLMMALAVLGVDRILFAVDYPFEEHEPAVARMDSAPLSESDRHKIYYQNSERVFAL